MNSRLVAALALFVALSVACTDPVADDPPPHQAPAAGEPQWITIGTDVLALAERAELLGEDAFGIEVVERGADVAVVRTRAGSLPALSELAHHELLRCGGLLAHRSEADARAALRAAIRPAARAPSSLVPAGYTIDDPATVMALQSLLEESEIRATIEGLSAFPNRYHASPSGTEAAEWLRDRWLGYAGDRTDVTVELIAHESSPQPSVAMTITGASVPDQVVVIGGHLDSIAPGGASSTAPGADDDASGIAVVSEMARVTMLSGLRPQRTIKLYAYAAEEVGLRGSQEIANAAEAAGDDVVAVMQLDMVNFPGSDIDLTLLEDYTDPDLTAFVGELIDTYVGATWEYDACGYGCSDHAAWTRAGFPAVTPFEARVRDINRALHTPQDTLARSDGTAEHALIFANLAAAYLAEIAGNAGATPECTDDAQCRVGEVCSPEGSCEPAPEPPPDAGMPEEPDAGTTSPPAPDAGTTMPPGSGVDGTDESADCGCASATPRQHLGGLLLITLVGLLATRRRRA